MQTIGSFFSGLSYAIHLIIKRKLYGYFIPAVIISVLFYFMLSGGNSLGNKLNFMEDWWLLGWLVTSMKSFFAFISFMLFEFVILVLLSPVNSILAEKAREDITGEELGFSMAVFMRSLRRMIVILIMAFFAQLLLTFVLWLFSFLLGDRFYEIASMFNVAFFIGFSFFDFSLELDEVNSRKSWKFAKKNWLACILIGLVFNLGIYYPEKHGLMIIYLIAITFLPHLLTLAASKMYYNAIDFKKENAVEKQA